MQLKREEIQQIANLARLELTEEELEAYGSQLSAILGYMDELKEVDVDNIMPTAQVTGLTNIAREDVAEPWPQDEVQAALEQAPEREGKFIKLKRVL